MTVACEHCGKRYNLASGLAGKKARCKACGQTFVVAEVTVEEPDFESLASGQDQSEVYQPSAFAGAGGAPSAGRAGRPQPIGLWIGVGAAVLVVIALLAMHPWTRSADNATPAALPPNSLPAPQVASGSTELVSPSPVVPPPVVQANESAIALGAFSITAPATLPAPTFVPDASEPEGHGSADARFGVVVWDLSALGHGGTDIKFIVTQREDAGHDVPTAPVDTQTFRERKHDIFNALSLRYLRVFYDDQPILYKAYDGGCAVEIHIDAPSQVPAELVEILEKMARSIHRIKPDAPQAPVVANPVAEATPAVNWQLTQHQKFVDAYEIDLPTGAEVTRTVADLDSYTVAAKKPNGEKVTVYLDFMPLPKDAFDEGSAKPARAGTGVSKTWVDINGFHYSKATMHTASGTDVSILYSAYREGRNISISCDQSSYDSDAAALIELMAQSLKPLK